MNDDPIWNKPHGVTSRGLIIGLLIGFFIALAVGWALS